MNRVKETIENNIGVVEHVSAATQQSSAGAKDPVNMLGYVAENIITGKIKQFFWDEVDKLPRDESVTLLDVHTKTEVSRGKIDGFIHIPLDSLREYLDEIQKDKPVYVHCHSSLRS